MSKPSFTPGPWTIPRPSMGFSQITGPNGELIFGLAAGSIDEKQPDDICKANANLIAAAPTMANYIVSRAMGGDSEAAAIWRKINGTTGDLT